MMSSQLKAVLNKCVFSSALKLVRDEADCTLLGREFQSIRLILECMMDRTEQILTWYRMEWNRLTDGMACHDRGVD